MPVEIHVSRAGPHDVLAMASIHRSCFAKAWDEATMAQFLAAPNALCLIGSIADNSGVIMAGLFIARKAADEAEILTFGVTPSYRRMGLGRTLLDAAIADLRASGAKRLFLEVEAGNGTAIALYRSLGAVAVGSRPGYYEHGADAAMFSLAL